MDSDACDDVHSAAVHDDGVCEGVSQLTGGRSAGFWVSFRKAAATLLCVEVIFTLTTARRSVTLRQQPLKGEMIYTVLQQNNIINLLILQHKRT